MICKEYDNLSVIEKTMLIGEVLHALMNDSECFELSKGIIKTAQNKGVFDGVKILPTSEPEQEY